MQFESGQLFHIYNRGNNRQKIFLARENYILFLQKVRVHVLPHADILAWCLMPNHFHLMVYVNQVEVALTPVATQSRARSETISFNKSIGIMLATYSRAINKQQNWTGSLFRSQTKAICLSESPATKTDTRISRYFIDNQNSAYPNVCFNYILKNPDKGGLVNRAIDWEFSSFSDFIGTRDGILINRSRIEQFGLHFGYSRPDFETEPDL